MKELIIKIREGRYKLFLQFLRTLDYVTVVQATPPKNEDSDTAQYDFSDLAGKLEWKGEALTQQRTLRDEW